MSVWWMETSDYRRHTVETNGGFRKGNRWQEFPALRNRPFLR